MTPTFIPQNYEQQVRTRIRLAEEMMRPATMENGNQCRPPMVIHAAYPEQLKLAMLTHHAQETAISVMHEHLGILRNNPPPHLAANSAYNDSAPCHNYPPSFSTNHNPSAMALNSNCCGYTSPVEDVPLDLSLSQHSMERFCSSALAMVETEVNAFREQRMLPVGQTGGPPPLPRPVIASTTPAGITGLDLSGNRGAAGKRGFGDGTSAQSSSKQARLSDDSCDDSSDDMYDNDDGYDIAGYYVMNPDPRKTSAVVVGERGDCNIGNSGSSNAISSGEIIDMNITRAETYSSASVQPADVTASMQRTAVDSDQRSPSENNGVVLSDDEEIDVSGFVPLYQLSSDGSNDGVAASNSSVFPARDAESAVCPGHPHNHAPNITASAEELAYLESRYRVDTYRFVEVVSDSSSELSLSNRNSVYYGDEFGNRLPTPSTSSSSNLQVQCLPNIDYYPDSEAATVRKRGRPKSSKRAYMAQLERMSQTIDEEEERYRTREQPNMADLNTMYEMIYGSSSCSP